MLRFILLAMYCSCLATGKDQRVTIKNYPDVYTVSADDSVFNYDELHRVALMSPLTGFDTPTEPFLAATGTHIDERTGKVVYDKVMLAPLLESCEHGKPNCPPTRVDDAFLQNARTNLDQGRQQIRLLQEMPLPKILEPVRSFFLDNLETTFRMQQARYDYITTEKVTPLEDLLRKFCLADGHQDLLRDLKNASEAEQRRELSWKDWHNAVWTCYLQTHKYPQQVWQSFISQYHVKEDLQQIDPDQDDRE